MNKSERAKAELKEKILVEVRQNNGNTVKSLSTIITVLDLVSSFIKKIEEANLTSDDIKNAGDYIYSEGMIILLESLMANKEPDKKKEIHDRMIISATEMKSMEIIRDILKMQGDDLL